MTTGTRRGSPLVDLPRPASDLMDRTDITDLVYRLYAAMDDHRFDDLAALCTGDAAATTPGCTARGREVMMAQATRNHTGHADLQHLITNVLIDLHGDRAAVRMHPVATFVRDGSLPELAIGALLRLQAQRAPLNDNSPTSKSRRSGASRLGSW